MPKPENLLRDILSDMKVELSEMFDRNFERKGFFEGEEGKWPKRKDTKARGSLLLVTGNLRRSIRSTVSGNSVRFSSPLPYAEVHNTGGKFTQSVRAHTKKNHKTGKSYAVKAHTRTLNMPQRQFIGDHPEVRGVVEKIVKDNVTKYFTDLAKELKK